MILRVIAPIGFAEVAQALVHSLEGGRRGQRLFAALDNNGGRVIKVFLGAPFGSDLARGVGEDRIHVAVVRVDSSGCETEEAEASMAFSSTSRDVRKPATRSNS